MSVINCSNFFKPEAGQQAAVSLKQTHTEPQHQQSQQLVSRPKSKAAKWSYRKTAIQLAMDTEQ